MKTTRLLAVATVTLASLPLMAQQAAASTQQSGSANAAQMQPVKGELAHKLDSKSARVGERVELKTTEDARTAGGTVIPKGSRLLGHVTEAQKDSKTHEGSLIGIEFDRAELKGGKSFAIHSVIESASQPKWVLAQDRMMTAAAGSAFEGPGPNGPAYGGQKMTGTATTGTNIAGNGMVGNAVLKANANGGQMGQAGTVVAQATGLPGVMLSRDANGAASGVFSMAQKNFTLLSGTQMVVGIVAAGN